MRLDKYLKVSRIIKRRTVAQEVASQGRVQVNGKIAKSSTDVKVGDEIKILFGNKTIVIEVLQIQDTTKKDAAKDMYNILSETKEVEYEKLD